MSHRGSLIRCGQLCCCKRRFYEGPTNLLRVRPARLCFSHRSWTVIVCLRHLSGSTRRRIRAIVCCALRLVWYGTLRTGRDDLKVRTAALW